MNALRRRTLTARRLRRVPTDAERLLWNALREAFPEIRLRRQHPIGRYIVDFACPSRKLAIEIDGGQHAEQGEADAQRTAEIARYGYRVIRFWNNEVFENLPGVLEVVQQELRAGKSLSALQGGGGAASSDPPPLAGEGRVGAGG